MDFFLFLSIKIEFIYFFVPFFSFIKYPGWSLKAEGTLVMATVNEDAAGTYTCTPYNSYGSMGSSQPTRAVLQVRDQDEC